MDAKPVVKRYCSCASLSEGGKVLLERSVMSVVLPERLGLEYPFLGHDAVDQSCDQFKRAFVRWDRIERLDHGNVSC